MVDTFKNERIRELYKQTTGKDWAYDFDPEIAERFAELIVQECAQFCEDKNSKLLGTIMKEHFGVEE
jgi:hypothetical protein